MNYVIINVAIIMGVLMKMKTIYTKCGIITD